MRIKYCSKKFKNIRRKTTLLVGRMVNFFFTKTSRTFLFLVARFLPGRTKFMCELRYKRSLCDTLKKGAWSKDEDDVSEGKKILSRKVIV